MKNFTLIHLSAILASLSLIMSCTTQPIDVSDEIVEANKAFSEAFNTGGIDAMAQLYTENGKLLPTNSEIIQGRENIKTFWSGAGEMGVEKVKLETTSAEGYGNTAIEEGKYTLYTEGDMVIDEGKYIVIWKKVDGQWLLDKDIWNTSYPAPLNLQLGSGNLFGLHTLKITLQENVSSSEFEKFFKEEYIPALEQHMPGVKFLLLKGERGLSKGEYGELIYFKSLEERDYWIPEPGNMSEKGEDAMNQMQPLIDRLFEMIEYESSFTDWLVL